MDGRPSSRGRRVLSFVSWSGNARATEREDLKPTSSSSVFKATSVFTEGTEFRSFNFVDRAAIPSAAHPCQNRPREFRPSPVIVVTCN